MIATLIAASIGALLGVVVTRWMVRHEAPVQKFVTGDKVWYTRHTRSTNFLGDVSYAEAAHRGSIADVSNETYFVQRGGYGTDIEAVSFTSARKQLALREEAEAKP